MVEKLADASEIEALFGVSFDPASIAVSHEMAMIAYESKLPGCYYVWLVARGRRTQPELVQALNDCHAWAFENTDAKLLVGTSSNSVMSGIAAQIGAQLYIGSDEVLFTLMKKGEKSPITDAFIQIADANTLSWIARVLHPMLSSSQREEVLRRLGILDPGMAAAVYCTKGDLTEEEDRILHAAFASHMPRLRDKIAAGELKRVKR